MSADDLGPLAAALAKAQLSFPPITRDKHVTVRTKDGKSYSFDYAPLEAILSATRGPLCDNGLALVQILDDGSLVTRLIHESGASLTGRVDLPAIAEIQAFGSAITYLRRYAIQAVLGIAAEDDDDGNRADGNTATPQVRREPTRAETEPPPADSDGSLIGTAEATSKASTDFALRQSPDGPVLGFSLAQGRGRVQVRCVGALAEQLDAARASVIGQTVTCWGRVEEREFTPRDKPEPVRYRVLNATRVRVPGLGDLPSAGPAAEAPARTEEEELDALAW